MLKAYSDQILDFLLIKVPLRILKRNVICNAGGAASESPKALLYFKTDPLFSPRLLNSFSHTNNFEITVMLEILGRLGFSVDLVDRDATWEELSQLRGNEYAILISNAAGLGAPFHSRVLQEFSARTKILFAAGPEPEESNRLVRQRHLDFEARTGRAIKHRRLIPGERFQDRFKGIDHIFFIGNAFSAGTFKKYSIPCHRIHPSSPPSLFLDHSAISNKDPRRFLYFGGNGLVCKGLDLVLEAFDGLREVQLDVCAPPSEEDFWSHYKPLLKRNPQIRYHGFVGVGGPLFSRLTEECAFNIFPASSEGSATSVTTCLRRGVIPIVTAAAGIDIGDFGIDIPHPSPDSIRNLVCEAAKMRSDEVRRRAVSAYSSSFRYTEAGFRESFESALLRVLLSSGHFSRGRRANTV